MRFMKGKQGRIAVERLFLLLYIPLVLAMMLVMPVGGPPDEQAHLKQVWLLSTGQVGNDGSASGCGGRNGSQRTER